MAKLSEAVCRRICARRAHPLAHIAPLQDGEVRPGRYRIRLVAGAVWAPVWIWFGRPIDPKSGRRMRGPYGFHALCDGEVMRLEEVWPRCIGEPISRAEYGYLRQSNKWARRYDRASPEAATRSAVDWRTLEPPF